jgi:hypothetical protein
MLHRIYLSVLGLIISLSVKAQMHDHNSSSSIGINYDDVSIGRNLSIVYRQPLGKKGWSVYGGGKYFINSRFFKNSPAIYTPFFKEFYAKETLGHFGAKLGVEKIFSRSDHCQLFTFSDFQFTAANVENIYKIFDVTKLDERHNLQLYAYETAIGIGMLLPVSQRMIFRLQAGLGINWYRYRDRHPYSLAQSDDGWSFNRTFALGLQYELKSATPLVVAKRKRRNDPDEYTENAIRLGYDDIQTGRNVNLTYSHGLAKGFSVYGGIKVNINSGLYDDFTKMETSHYFKQFWAKGMGQRFGLKAGVEYSFAIPNSNVKLFSFYDFQLSHSDVRNLVALDEFASGVSRSTNVGGNVWGFIIGDGLNDPVAYPPKPMYRIYGTVTALENYVGLGAKFAISDKMNFRIQGGIGYNIYLGPDTYNDYDIAYFFRYEHHENVPWTANKSELSRMFSFGLEYKIAKRDR